MFGLSMEKIIIVIVVAAFIIGPQRIPLYAAKLAQLVKTVRGMADNAKERVTAEMGPEFQDLDWKKLDPRQYDPRNIIRTALLDDDKDRPTISTPRKDDESDPLYQPVKPVNESKLDLSS